MTMKPLTFIFVALLPFLMNGCSVVSATTQPVDRTAANASIIRDGAVLAGMAACQQIKNPATIATLQNDLTNTVIPYLSAKGTTDETLIVENALFGTISKDVGPQYRPLLQIGLDLLSEFYVVNPPNAALPPDQLLYLQAFAAGLSQGISEYQSDLAITKLHASRTPVKPTAPYYVK